MGAGSGDVTLPSNDVLPLPMGKRLHLLLTQKLPSGSSSSVLRRRQRHRGQNEWLLDGVNALNELCGSVDSASPDRRLSAAQESAVAHLGTLYGSLPDDLEELSDDDAYWKLRRAGAGYGDGDAAGGYAVYRPGQVAFPSCRSGDVVLQDLLPSDLAALLNEDGGLLRDAGTRDELLSALESEPALDPKLSSSPRTFAIFLQDLTRRGLVEISERPYAFSGLFFVRKKDCTLRMIFDTRAANCHFEDPHKTVLSSGEALGNLEFQAKGDAVLMSGDVESCFYQYQLPPWLRPFFCLPAVARKHFDVSFLKEMGVERVGDALTFQPRVVPMGWAWAVFFIQAVHLRIFRGILPDSPWSLDKVVAPPLTASRPAKLLYIDNFAVIGSSESNLVQVSGQDMQTALREVAVASLMDAPVQGDGDLIGYHLRGHQRMWTLTGICFGASPRCFAGLCLPVFAAEVKTWRSS